MGKENYTEDGDHISFGHDDSIPSIPNHNPADQSKFVAQAHGRVIDEDGCIVQEV